MGIVTRERLRSALSSDLSGSLSMSRARIAQKFIRLEVLNRSKRAANSELQLLFQIFQLNFSLFNQLTRWYL